MPEKRRQREPNEPFPFWSGTISFGLVSVPVDLYSSVRTHRVPMRMLSEKGVPLKRKYYCSADNKQLTQKEIVRGYEQDDGTFVIITDEELEKLSPRKSRDIDLRLFVDRDMIPVRLLDRPYILAPGGESTKAYHLLVQTMEQMNLAGIATFVMRGKEYLTAIIAEGGLLRAMTLHFNDEIRTPESIGLPEVEKAPDTVRKTAQKALRPLVARELDLEIFADTTSAELLDLAERKQEQAKDVVEVSTEVPADESEDEGADIIDIMTVLRQRMDGKDETGPKKRDSATSGKEPPPSNGARPGKAIAPDGLESASKQELYDKASEMEIAGRSSMSKDQLLSAIRRAK